MHYKNFGELPVSIVTREIVNLIYNVIRIPDDLKKDLQLKGQLSGAGVSIMNNIADGFDSDSNNEFVRFLRYSQRSTSQIMSLTYVLKDFHNLDSEANELYEKTLVERKQLKGFINYLKSLN